LTVTVAIKAYNEASKIGAAIASALEAVEPLGGEVVLGDCRSQDDTVAVGRGYPIRIFQLTDPSDRSCGAGAQLAFQGVNTPFFYLMDGDMTLSSAFLPKALAWLQANSEYAGVGGEVSETLVANAEFRIREASARHEHHRREGDVDRLDGGGLYRMSAIQDVGYFSNRNLNSYEEFDLAARLRSKGWKLARIPVVAVQHHGHTTASLRLLWRRFASGQLGGAGAVLRAALDQAHLPHVLSSLKEVRYVVAIFAWWLAILSTALTHQIAFLTLILAPIAILCVRRRSVLLGLYSFLYWNLFGLGFAKNFLAKRMPTQWGVPAIEVSPLQWPAAPRSAL